MTGASDDIDPVTVSSALARLIPEEDSQTLPIACRFVPQDQWLVSHIDTSWKIKDIKHWILAKCNAWGPAAPQAPRFRPASPVTFAASRRSSVESSSRGDSDEEDWDEFVSGDAKDSTTDRYSAGAGRSSFNSSEDIHPPMIPESVTHKYALYSFSCGHLLEDEASLSWYNLRPFELLEMHRVNGVIALPRTSLLAYIEPYFEATVMVSEGATSRKSRKGRSGRISEERNAAWLVRWAFIREGVLNLCKDRSCLPTHRFPLHALSAIRGPEVLQSQSQTSQSTANHFVVCAKFRLPTPTPAESDEAIGIRYQWHRQERVKVKPARTSTWVVLDMLEANSYDNFLRVLHRLAPCSVQSTFVPTLPTTLPKTPMPSPTADVIASPSPSPAADATSFLSFGVRYPDWRIALVERARKAGLGDVGPAMGHYLYGTDESQTQNHGLRRQASMLSNLRYNAWRRDASDRHSVDGSVGMSEGMTWMMVNGDVEDEDDGDDEDGDSEVEWEGWVRDTARRVQEMQEMEHRATSSLPTPSPSPGPRPLSPNPPDFSSPGSNFNDMTASYISPSSPTSPSASSHSHSLSHSSEGSPGSPSGRTRTLSFAPDPRKANAITSAFVTVGGTVRTRTRERSATVTAASLSSSSSVLLNAAESGKAVVSRDRSDRDREATPVPVPINTNVSSSSTLRRESRRQFVSARVALSPPNSSSSGSPLSASVNAPMSASGSSSSASPPTSSLPSPTISGMKRIVNLKGVSSIRGAFSSDKISKGLEDSLDFVDGK